MGNKNKDETPNPANVANRDVLQRLNFLYQASVLLNGLAPPRPIPDDEDEPSTSPTTHDGVRGDAGAGPSRPNKSRKRRAVTLEELSRSYVETMKSVGRKTNVRMDPSVKRRLCKRCSAPLVPGVSATVRVRESTSHGHLVSYRCHACQTERRLPAPPVLRLSSTDGDAAEGQPAEDSALAAGDPARAGQRKRKKGPQPRLPPHFAREVGHVVFRGNECRTAKTEERASTALATALRS